MRGWSVNNSQEMNRSHQNTIKSRKNLQNSISTLLSQPILNDLSPANSTVDIKHIFGTRKTSPDKKSKMKVFTEAELY